MQWGAGVVIAAVMYAAIDDTTWAIARQWSSEADQLEALLVRAEKLKVLPADIENAVVVHGQVRSPRDESTGSQSLAEAITGVMDANRITSFSFEARTGSKLPAGTFSGALPAGRRVERISAEVSFTTGQDEAFKALSEIESNEAVDAIRTVRLDWDDGSRKVSVRTTVDAWVIASARVRKSP